MKKFLVLLSVMCLCISLTKGGSCTQGGEVTTLQANELELVCKFDYKCSMPCFTQDIANSVNKELDHDKYNSLSIVEKNKYRIYSLVESSEMTTYEKQCPLEYMGTRFLRDHVATWLTPEKIEKFKELALKYVPSLVALQEKCEGNSAAVASVTTLEERNTLFLKNLLISLGISWFFKQEKLGKPFIDDLNASINNGYFTSGDVSKLIDKVKGTFAKDLVNYVLDKNLDLKNYKDLIDCDCSEIRNVPTATYYNVCASKLEAGGLFKGSQPATQAPTTQAPTTQAPTTQAPTTQAPTTQAPTTQAPTTQAPTTKAPTTKAPTTKAPTTQAPTTKAPTTKAPTTQAPTTQAPTKKSCWSRTKRKYCYHGYVLRVGWGRRYKCDDGQWKRI